MYTKRELRKMKTLSTGQADDLKIDTGETRIWLSRCTVADGEPYNNKVTVERLVDGRANPQFDSADKPEGHVWRCPAVRARTGRSV